MIRMFKISLLMKSSCTTVAFLHKDVCDDCCPSDRQLELVVSLLGIAVPPLFEGISEMEEFHPRVALKWQLGRILALFVANLYSLTFALYDEVPLKVKW